MMDEKDCYCHTCKKRFHRLGIARHRAAHRTRHEDCEIEYDDGKARVHQFSQIKYFLPEKGGG